MRLRDNVTTTEAQKAGTMAVTTKAGSATNATAAYVYAGLGTRLVSQPWCAIRSNSRSNSYENSRRSLGDPVWSCKFRLC